MATVVNSLCNFLESAPMQSHVCIRIRGSIPRRELAPGAHRWQSFAVEAHGRHGVVQIGEVHAVILRQPQRALHALLQCANLLVRLGALCMHTRLILASSLLMGSPAKTASRRKCNLLR